MKDRIQEMEKNKQLTHEGGVEENHNLRDRIKELEEKLTNNLTPSNCWITERGGESVIV
jgi:hypothetical protein